ncbi:MAG: TIGR04076 family protein [Candidatus Bathyarchaeota archaeon]|nr:TIGR04076 family protein [Candidatus Bathyarchaeota archaeon]
MARVKITVLKKIDPKRIYKNVPVSHITGEKFGICTHFNEGQEFIVDNCCEMPKGFCFWAWHDIFKDLSVLTYGGNFPWFKEGEVITCCTDGVRPVSFLLQRIK